MDNISYILELIQREANSFVDDNGRKLSTAFTGREKPCIINKHGKGFSDPERTVFTVHAVSPQKASFDTSTGFVIEETTPHTYSFVVVEDPTLSTPENRDAIDVYSLHESLQEIFKTISV